MQRGMHLVGAEPGVVATLDPVWDRMCVEAEAAAAAEPALATFFHETVLNQRGLGRAVALRLAQRLAGGQLSNDLLNGIFESLLDDNPSLIQDFQADLVAIFDRDPACTRLIEPLLYYKGFHALQVHRFAHLLLKGGRRDIALYLQSEASKHFAMDINPAARIGRGIFIDHGHGIVIGETAVVEDDVSMLHGVTLGGTGKEAGDRHPKIGKSVLIGAGAKVLGNIKVGNCSRVAAGSVVLREVPPCKTVAGVPAKIVGEAGCSEPSRTMNQILGTADESPKG